MRSGRRRSSGALPTLALLVVPWPACLSGQIRPEAGLSGGLLTSLSGPALGSLDEDTSLGMALTATLVGRL